MLGFLPVESKKSILYVNINFTGNLFFGFARYWTFPRTNNVLSFFFYMLTLSKWQYKQKGVRVLICFIGFESTILYMFFIKMSCFGSNLFFEK